MAGYALALTYNLPELVGKPPLMLDLYTLSLAFAGNISKWNDQPIQEYVHSLLPVTLLQH
jgi:hypothetical protein